MGSTKKRSNCATNLSEGSHHKKRRFAEHVAGPTHDAHAEKPRVDIHSSKQQKFASGSNISSHPRDHVRNPTVIPHEVSKNEGNRKGQAAPKPESLTSGHWKALNYPKPRNQWHHSPFTPKTKYNGTHESLPALPPLPDDIARVVFTHQGALQGGNVNNVNLSYERLEFLGDAYIELIATRLVYPRFPSLPVGRLSQQRELLVKNETLAEYARAYGFDRRVHLSNSYKETGDSKVNKKYWTKLMGDVMEAYVAAIILSDSDNGFQVAEAWLHSLWENKLAAQHPAETELVDSNAKVSLSQRVMGVGIKLEYREEASPTFKDREGKVWYHIGVFLTGWGFKDMRLGGGTGLSKPEAGQNAAADALGARLTAQVAVIKRDFDRKVKEQREKEEREKAAAVATGKQV
ncbi:MAG: hypothetical protein Q9217_000406 [Psora testacea]